MWGAVALTIIITVILHQLRRLIILILTALRYIQLAVSAVEVEHVQVVMEQGENGETQAITPGLEINHGLLAHLVTEIRDVLIVTAQVNNKRLFDTL